MSITIKSQLRDFRTSNIKFDRFMHDPILSYVVRDNNDSKRVTADFNEHLASEKLI